MIAQGLRRSSAACGTLGDVTVRGRLGRETLRAFERATARGFCKMGCGAAACGEIAACFCESENLAGKFVSAEHGTQARELLNVNPRIFQEFVQ